MDIGNIFNISFDSSLQWFQSLIYLYKSQEVKLTNQEIVFEAYINLAFKNKLLNSKNLIQILWNISRKQIIYIVSQSLILGIKRTCMQQLRKTSLSKLTYKYITHEYSALISLKFKCPYALYTRLLGKRDNISQYHRMRTHTSFLPLTITVS